MIKRLKYINLIIFLINTLNSYCQNKQSETFLVSFKVDCEIDNNPFFEFQTVFITDIENNSNEEQCTFYHNGNKFKTKSEFLNVNDSIYNKLVSLSNSEKDSLIINSKSKSFLIEKIDKDLAISNYERIKNKPIALSFYSYFDDDSQEIIGKRLYFNLSKKTIKRINLKVNGYNEYIEFLGSKTIIHNQIIKPKKSFKFKPIKWNNTFLNKIEINELIIEYNDGTKIKVKNENIPAIKYYNLYLLFGSSALLSN